MTTPDSHRDTYAESYHRDFFPHYARGVAPERCAGAESRDAPSIGGLVALPLVMMAALRENDSNAGQNDFRISWNDARPVCRLVSRLQPAPRLPPVLAGGSRGPRAP